MRETAIPRCLPYLTDQLPSAKPNPDTMDHDDRENSPPCSAPLPWVLSDGYLPDALSGGLVAARCPFEGAAEQ